MTRVIWARVLGRDTVVWSTGDPSAYPSGSDAYESVLLAIPAALTSRLDSLDTLAADSTVDLQIAITIYTESLLYASRVMSDPIERLTRGVSAGATRIYTTGTTVPQGDPIWIELEAMIVDAVEVDGYTVTRGAYGSVPVAHGIGPISQTGRPRAGTRIYTRAPDIVGQWVEVGYSEGGVATTVWRGVVTSIGTADRTSVTIHCSSLMSALRSRTVAEPACTRIFGQPVIGAYLAPASPSERIYTDRWPQSADRIVRGSAGAPLIWWDLDEHPGMPAEDGYVRLCDPSSGAYVVLAASYHGDAEVESVGTGGIGTLRARGYTLTEECGPSSIVQASDGSALLGDAESIGSRSAIASVLTLPVGDLDVTWVSVTQPDAQSAVLSLLTSRDLPMYGGGLPDEWVDVTTAGTLALTGGATWTSLRSYDALLWVPTRVSGTLLSYVERALLAPLGAGLAHDDGVVLLIDWGRDVTDPVDTVDDDVSRQPRRYEWERDAYAGAATARLTHGSRVEVVATDRSRGSVIGASARDIDCAAIVDLDALVARWAGLTYRYGVALPSVTLSVRTGAARVGSVVALSRSDLPYRSQGVPADEEGVVVQRTRSVRTDVDVLTIVVTTWVEDAQGLRWGPAASVDSATDMGGGTVEITIAADAWSADDPAVWALVDLPESVDVLDATGAVIEASATLSAVSGDVLTVLMGSGAPPAGSLIVLSPAAQIAGAPNLARWSWLTPSAISPDYVWGP